MRSVYVHNKLVTYTSSKNINRVCMSQKLCRYQGRFSGYTYH